MAVIKYSTVDKCYTNQSTLDVSYTGTEAIFIDGKRCLYYIEPIGREIDSPSK